MLILQEKNESELSSDAQLWKNALFLTTLFCFFLGVYGGTFHGGQYTCEFLNIAVIFNVASHYLPKIINYFSKEEEAENGL